MRMRHVITAGLMVGVALTLMAPLAAQKIKTTSRPGTATFRCNEGEPISCGIADRVRGVHGDSYAGLGTPQSGQGAHLSADGELWITLRNGVDVVLDLTDLDQTGSCVAAGNCRFSDAGLTTPTISIPIGGTPSSGVYALIRGNVITPDGDTTPTMLDLPPGEPFNIRLNITFNDEVMGLLWGFSFNASHYPGAVDATVTRTGCTWVITGSKAGLSAYGSTGRGKAYRTDEGLYNAPFEITFSVPSPCQ